MAAVEDQEAVITIKVKLESDVTGLEGITQGGQTHDPFLSGVTPDISEIIEQEVKNTVDDLIGESLEEAGVNLESVQQMSDAIDEMGINGIKNLTSFAKSPENFSENMFMKVLSRAGPYGALATALIGIMLASPELFQAVVAALGVKGGPLNQDFRYSLDEQENQQFERIIQYRRLTGDDPVITVTTKGYVVGDPDFVGSSLINADIARTARIGLRESSLGIIDGI